MSDTGSTAADAAGPSGPRRLRVVPPFDAARFRRELAADSALRWAAFLVLPIVLATVTLLQWVSEGLWALGLIVAAVLWMSISVRSARAWQQVAALGPRVEQEPERAEDLIAQSLGCVPLQRSVRMMLYHRLAVVRHHQRRFAEVATICHHVLREPLGAAEQVRPHLLLMLAEARLIVGDPAGAYVALSALAKQKLNLVETLQHLALRTRYLVETGYCELALADLGRTVAMVELMPPPQCGAVHALLAVAADALRHADLARWLHDRARLLSTPQQMDTLIGPSASASMVRFDAGWNATMSQS